MDAAIIRAVNKLWLPAYPGIARQIAEHCTRPPGRILEAGCFSGGIGLMLLQQFPESTLSLALEIEELTRTFASDWEGLIDARRPDRYQILPAPLVFLDRPLRTFDLVIFRGVFFFLDEGGDLLSRLYRFLSPGGFVFAGGGYGAYTPPEVIEGIAEESRRLNQALGRKIFSREAFEQANAGAGLAARSRLIEEGGLWAIMKKA